MQCKSVVCESVERVHGVNPWLIRSMNRLCYDCWYLWYMQYVLGNLKQIDDILVAQIEEEIAEVSKSIDRVFETGHSIPICVDRVMCLSEHSSMHMYACFQLSLVV